MPDVFRNLRFSIAVPVATRLDRKTVRKTRVIGLRAVTPPGVLRFVQFCEAVQATIQKSVCGESR